MSFNFMAAVTICNDFGGQENKICHFLLLLPSVFPRIRVFSSESVLCIRWPKYWSFSFSISPREYSGLISFRIDWFDLLAFQGTLKSFLQHHSSKASILGRRERWRRNRTARPLSPSQIPQKNISMPSKLHKTTSVGWQRTLGIQKSRSLSSKTDF